MPRAKGCLRIPRISTFVHGSREVLEEKIKDARLDIKFSEDLGWKMGLGGASFEVRTAGSIVS